MHQRSESEGRPRDDDDDDDDARRDEHTSARVAFDRKCHFCMYTWIRSAQGHRRPRPTHCHAYALRNYQLIPIN